MTTLVLGILTLCAASMLWGIMIGGGGWGSRDPSARTFRLMIVGFMMGGGALIWLWWWTT